jgi:AcrR family transcriptional regulator
MLIDERHFDDITLREITTAAGVSYPTFFNNYGSKEDLFRDVARVEILALLDAFRDGRALPDWRPGVEMCAHILGRRTLWRTLLTAGATEAMRTEFLHRARELEHEQPDLGHGFPIEVVAGVVASGTFEIIAWWLDQDADYPAAGVANMLETLVIEPALHLQPGFFTSRKGLAKI